MLFSDFRPLKLLLCFIFAIVLFGSFQWIEETRAFWDMADRAVFYTLNGSLHHNMAWAYFWALGNNTLFDLLSFLFMLLLAYQYVMEEGDEGLNRRVAHFLYMVIIVALTVGVIDKLLNISHERHSPTAVLPNAFMLGSIATWFHAKDISFNSYPSDHAIVLTTFTLLIWHFAGKRKGRMMLGAALFFCLPRLFGGGHWLTDMVCGSVPLALVTYSIGVYTPVKRFSIYWLNRFTDIPLVAAGIRLFFHEETPALLAKGIGMGSAEVIPGVGGSTVAYLSNVWGRLMDAISSINKAWLKLVFTGKWTEALKNPHLALVVPLVIGTVAAFVIFSQLFPLSALIQMREEPVYGLFFGIVAGSVALQLMKLGRMSLKEYVALALGAVTGWLIVTLAPEETPNAIWFIFLCGYLTVCAMLLPGISGLFILLVLGKYGYVLEAFMTRDVAVISAFLLGSVAGLFTFARVASWLVHHHCRISVAAITGIIAGSLWVIWPFQQRGFVEINGQQHFISATPELPEALTLDASLAVGFGVVAFMVVMCCGMLSARGNK